MVRPCPCPATAVQYNLQVTLLDHLEGPFTEIVSHDDDEDDLGQVNEDNQPLG